MQNLVYKTFELNTDIEHFAKPINLSGATTIRLTYLPSGVECWISSESNGTNLYPLVNRGDGWVDLPEPLYNLYIYTKGTNVDNEKIILNYTGQRDFFQYGNSSTERIDKVGNLESVSNNVLYDLFKVRNDMFSTRKLVFFDFVNASYELPLSLISSSRYLGITKIADLRQLDFTTDKIYSILLEGHCDMSGNNISTDSTGWSSTMSESLHFDLINMDSVDTSRFTQMTQSTSNTNTTIDSNQIQNLMLLKTTDNFILETRGNHFTLLGMKQSICAWWQNQAVANSGMGYALTTPSAGNFSKRFFAPYSYFQNMKDLICSWKAQLSLSNNYGNYGFHFGIKIQIEEMESLPNDPIINTKPYINPRFLKQG